MSRVRVSPLARRDIDLIAAHIALDDRAAAQRMVLRIAAAVRRLALMPRIGHRRPDLTPLPLLFWTVASHLVVYRAVRGGIEVVRVIHGARDVRRLLGEEE